MWPVGTPAAIESSRRAPAATAAAAAAGTSGGLTASTAAEHGGSRGSTWTPGRRSASWSRRAASASETARRSAGDAAGEQPAGEGGAHVAAADDHEVEHRPWSSPQRSASVVRAAARGPDIPNGRATRTPPLGVTRRPKGKRHFWADSCRIGFWAACQTPIRQMASVGSGGEAAGETNSQEPPEDVFDGGVEGADCPVQLVGGDRRQRKFAAKEDRILDAD